MIAHLLLPTNARRICEIRVSLLVEWPILPCLHVRFQVHKFAPLQVVPLKRVATTFTVVQKETANSVRLAILLLQGCLSSKTSCLENCHLTYTRQNLNARGASRRHQLGSVHGDCGFDVSLVHLVCNEDAQGRSAPFEKCTRPIWCFVHHSSNLSSIRALPRAVNWLHCKNSMVTLTNKYGYLSSMFVLSMPG